MADEPNNAIQRIYEGTPLTVRANIPTGAAGSVEEVTFRFCKDGEQFEEKTGPVSEVHTIQAPVVPDDQESYFLEYHVFYTVKNRDGATEKHQNLSAKKLEVVPRTAQLKVSRDKDGEPFHNFQFKVVQRGEQVGQIQSTFAHDTQNAKDETIPAGTAEFNLDPIPGFQIVQQSPFEITEHVVMDGRKREVKGELKFRATFVAPKRGNIRQYVNGDTENMGRDGAGHEVFIEVGAHPEDEDFLRGNDDAEVYFRVTFGPEGDGPVTKSARNDSDHPTVVLKPSENDTNVTIEEKEANKKYQGSVKLTGGTGMFKVGLGVAGGDTCKVEIAGSDKFLTNESLSPDATLQFENWRRVHYELMLPDIMRDRALDLTSGTDEEAEDKSAWNLSTSVLRRLETLGRQPFIEFAHDATHVFDAVEQADDGTLTEGRFLELPGREDEPVYVLSGRNWREPPQGEDWLDAHPGKTLCIHLCDGLLKWRKDTDDPQKAPNDFSGALTEATGFIDVEEKFGGLYMPFSGYDGGDGITDFKWTADISRDDDVCKYSVEMELTEDRTPDEMAEVLYVDLESEALAAGTEIVFTRPPYPDIELVEETTEAEEDDEDDGVVTLKEPNLGKELTLQFEVQEAGESETEVDEDEEVSLVTADHEGQLDAFFKDLFETGKDQLRNGNDTNLFKIEIHASTGSPGRDQRYNDTLWAVQGSYERTYDHAQHMFQAELGDAEISQIQGFVDELLGDTESLIEVEGKVEVTVTGPKDTGHGEDDCFNAVKDKLQELFDTPENKEFLFHPGLDAEGEPREGSCSLAEVTDGGSCTVKQWHFTLPVALPDGTPGPGAFVGPEKTRDQCPVKVEFSVQAHERSEGEVDGNLIAWVCTPSTGAKHLVRLILKAFDGIEDTACSDHGHGGDGMPGDCLVDSDSLCEACVEYGRSKDLTVI